MQKNHPSFAKQHDPLNNNTKKHYQLKNQNISSKNKKAEQQTDQKQFQKKHSKDDLQKSSLKTTQKQNKNVYLNVGSTNKTKQCPSFILIKQKSYGDITVKSSQNPTQDIQHTVFNKGKTQDFSKCQYLKKESNHLKNPENYQIKTTNKDSLKAPNNLNKPENLKTQSVKTSTLINSNQKDQKRQKNLNTLKKYQKNSYKSKSSSKIQINNDISQLITQPNTPTLQLKLNLSKSKQGLLQNLNEEKQIKQRKFKKQDIYKLEGQYWKKKFQDKNQVKQLNIDDFEFIQKLGKGSYGTVYLSKQKKSNFLCAIKKISKKLIKKNKIQEQLIRQIKIQSSLYHQNIISLYKVLCDSDYIYLVMEYLPGSDLSKCLDKFELNEHQTALIIQKICKGVCYLHLQGIIHRDLKPQNIFCYQDNIKIGDFGCAVNGPNLRSTFIGCMAYLSPQQLKEEAYRQKIDIWSIGIMTYQMLMGKCPFDSDIVNILRKQKQAKLSKINFDDDLWISQQCRQFIQKMLKQNPNQRMSIQQALNHKFLRKHRQYYENSKQDDKNQDKLI